MSRSRQQRDELESTGVTVTALHVGYMDTDMVADVDAAKTDPMLVATAALDGVEQGMVEVLADTAARDAKAALSRDRGVAESSVVTRR